MLKLLLFSLAITLSASLLLFFYFKNKIGNMENKLNSMYQIIQSYNNYDENLIINNYDKHDDRIDLIGKNDERESESESESESDDEYDSDEEDTKEIIDLEKGVQNIDLAVVGHEMTKGIQGSNIEFVDNLNAVNLDKNSEIKKMEETLGQDSETEEDKEEENTSSDEEQVDEELNTDSKNEEIDVETKKKQWATMYKVSELKIMAEEKGLANYQKLKKNDLIEMIIKSE